MPVSHVCYAPQDPIYGPAMRLIESITNASPAVIVTTFPHGYTTGTIVRLDIPPACGMQQADGQTGAILILSEDSFSITINTIGYDPFSIPEDLAPWVNICAQVVPIGEVNETLKAAVQNQLP